MQTGFAFIGNPYYECPVSDPHWRHKDGDTVIGCDRNHRLAMSVQDAYQQLDENRAAERAEWEDEQAYYDDMMEQDHRDLDEHHARDLWDSTVGVFFDIQDRLDGIRLRIADITEVGTGGYGKNGGLLWG
jgi:hypothetical protein